MRHFAPCAGVARSAFLGLAWRSVAPSRFVLPLLLVILGSGAAAFSVNPRENVIPDACKSAAVEGANERLRVLGHDPTQYRQLLRDGPNACDPKGYCDVIVVSEPLKENGRDSYSIRHSIPLLSCKLELREIESEWCVNGADRDCSGDPTAEQRRALCRALELLRDCLLAIAREKESALANAVGAEAARGAGATQDERRRELTLLEKSAAAYRHALGSKEVSDFLWVVSEEPDSVRFLAFPAPGIVPGYGGAPSPHEASCVVVIRKEKLLELYGASVLRSDTSRADDPGRRRNGAGAARSWWCSAPDAP